MNWFKKISRYRDKLKGGIADNKTPSDFNKKDLERGHLIEFEHTNDPNTAREIAMDHLEEHKDYYHNDKGLPAMEDKMEDTKDAGRGLYNQQQGDSFNQDAGEERLNDWLADFKDELKHMKALAQQHRFNDMASYRDKLIGQGYPPTKIDGLMSAAMHGVKL